MKTAQQQLDRIMGHVDKAVKGDYGCWIWTGKGRSGLFLEYGATRLFGKMMSTHRAVWILLRGPIKGIDLLHQCPHKLCCNPDHLRMGNQSQNSKEAVAARGGPWGSCTNEFKAAKRGKLSVKLNPT